VQDNRKSICETPYIAEWVVTEKVSGAVTSRFAER